MSKIPRISLIICAYNEEKYIKTCLEHVIRSSERCYLRDKNQKFHEIILVDNASTDNTRIIAEGFPQVRVVKEEKKGLTRARQAGYLNATGDILAYVDADTKMPEWWLEEVYNEFTKNPTLSCLSGPYIYYDIASWKQFLVKFGYWYTLAYPAYFAIGYMAVGGNFAIKKEVIKKMGGFDTTIEFYGEDTNIARRASRLGTVKFKPQFIMYSSARRLINQSMFKMMVLYISNYLSEAVLHKPITQEYQDFR